MATKIKAKAVQGDHAAENRRLLRRWLENTRWTQAALAKRFGGSRQQINQLLASEGRLAYPSLELASLIDTATDGAVPQAGWFTPERWRQVQTARDEAARVAMNTRGGHRG